MIFAIITASIGILEVTMVCVICLEMAENVRLTGSTKPGFKKEDDMYALIRNIYRYILNLRLRIKLMTQDQFDNFAGQLDYEQKIYSILLRYY